MDGKATTAHDRREESRLDDPRDGGSTTWGRDGEDRPLPRAAGTEGRLNASQRESWNTVVPRHKRQDRQKREHSPTAGELQAPFLEDEVEEHSLSREVPVKTDPTQHTSGLMEPILRR